MEKIKFDFEATKERIYAPNSNVPIGAPVDRNGNIANDGNAYGIVLCKETENEKYWVKYNLVVMVAGYCDIIDAQAIWGDEYSAEAIAAMSDIIFCDDHKIGGGGGGWPSDLPKPSVGGYGYTEQGELEEIFTKDFVSELNQGIYGVQFENETGATISIGNSYVVNFDGEEFHCIGVSAGDLNGVGNTSLMPTGGDNTGEPFVAAFDEDFGMIITAEGGNHSITISAPSDTVHKIDEKYLPSGALTFYIDRTSDESHLYLDDDETFMVDYETFKSSLGKRVVLIDFDSGNHYFPSQSVDDGESGRWGYYIMVLDIFEPNYHFFGNTGGPS